MNAEALALHKTKLLGVHVTEYMHTLTHLTARAQGLSVSDWLRKILTENVDQRALFFVDGAQSSEQIHSEQNVTVESSPAPKSAEPQATEEPASPTLYSDEWYEALVPHTPEWYEEVQRLAKPVQGESRMEKVQRIKRLRQLRGA